MFRFTIRELLLLTLAGGLAVGWWLDHEEGAKWRMIAGGLEHIISGRGWEVGVADGRLWVGSAGRPRHMIGSVGLKEFEPKLKECEPPPAPLEDYYSNWPRTPDDEDE